MTDVGDSFVIQFAGGLSILLAWALLVRWWLWQPSRSSRQHEVKTALGHTLKLYEFQPTTASRGVVWCVPGIYSNASIFDVMPGHGLAVWLRDQGYTVWTMDLSVSNRPWRRLPRRFFRDWSRRYEDYANDEYIGAATFIRERSGGARLHFIGHSMGGMSYYAFAATQVGKESLASASTLGSMAKLTVMPRPIGGLLRSLAFLLTAFPTVPARQLAQLVMAPTLPLLAPLAWFFCKRGNVSIALQRRHFYNNTSNHPTRALNSFAAVMAGRSLVCGGGLPSIHTPTQVLAASHDRVANYAHVRHGFDSLTGLSAEQKEFVHLEGFGHNDMVFAPAANQQVWPILLRWIERHSPRS